MWLYIYTYILVFVIEFVRKCKCCFVYFILQKSVIWLGEKVGSVLILSSNKVRIKSWVGMVFLFKEGFG